MSPLLAFILFFSIFNFIRLHYRAGKRIRALEEALAQMALSNLETVKAVSMVHDEVLNHDKDLMAIRIKLKMKEQEDERN